MESKDFRSLQTLIIDDSDHRTLALDTRPYKNNALMEVHVFFSIRTLVNSDTMMNRKKKQTDIVPSVI